MKLGFTSKLLLFTRIVNTMLAIFERMAMIGANELHRGLSANIACIMTKIAIDVTLPKMELSLPVMQRRKTAFGIDTTAIGLQIKTEVNPITFP